MANKAPQDDIYEILDSLGDESESFVAPWNWHDLPIDDGDLKLHILTSGETLVIVQHDGRDLRLGTLHQYPTYAGLLAGIPQARDINIEQAIKRANEIFGDGVESPALLRPRLFRLPDPERQIPTFPFARLPLVTTITQFESKPTGDQEAFRSSGIVIWWQEHFGLPTDEHILMQLRDLDWPAHAWDWNP